ncbi:MAG TPA: hypothetical protein VGD27_05745 [Longimicrobiales bacterium]
MRIPVALLLTLLVAPLATAQDLQLSIRMQTVAPQAGAMPVSDMTMYIKGSKLRVDQAMREMSTSMIYDSAAGKTWVLLHGERIFMETPNSPYAGKTAAPDSATLAALGMTPSITSTGEQQMIGGHKAERFLSVMRMPAGMGEPGAAPVTLVSEHWLATDARLNASYYAYAARMQMLTGASGQAAGAWEEALKKRVPLKTTMVMIEVPANEKIDAAAVLRAANPKGFKMRATVELQDIKTGLLPDSLFVVPKGYTASKLQ